MHGYPCGTAWLSPIGVILLSNRVRGDVKPAYASCTLTGAKKSGMSRQLTSDEAQAHLKRFEWRRRFIDPLAAHLLIIPKNET